MKLSIIIVSWNTKELLEKCLESVIHSNIATKQHSNIATEIIVVDNGSVDGSVQEVKNLKFDIENSLKIKNLKLKIIENVQNLGFAKGNNQGVKVAEGEYIMLLNSDTIVKEGMIEKLVEFAEGSGEVEGCGGVEKHKSIAVSPLLLLPSGKTQSDYYMRFPNLWQIFLYHNPVLRPIIMRMPFLSLLIAQKSQNSPFAVDQLPGAALMAHQDVWSKVGLLDEDYHFLFEDVDWCWRAKKLGVKLMVVPETKIIHIGGASWKKRVDKDALNFYYQFFASMLLFVRKNYGGWSAIAFNWAIILDFILTLKPLLAWRFLRGGGAQKEFLR